MAQVLAQQYLAKREKQTQRIEKQDTLATVQDERNPQGKEASRRRARRAPAEAETETQAANSTPFAGHIIDVKI